MKNYVMKPVEFAYPDKQGKVEILKFKLIAEEQDADTFDKFMNYLRSAVEYSGGKTMPIYDFKEEHEEKPTR